jgi:disulfide bond formation protein DsbB
MSLMTYRKLQHVLLFLTMFVLGMVFYFEYMKNMEPCPLCLMQRLCVFLFGLFCMIGIRLVSLRRIRTVTIFQIFFALAGLYFAGRQVWLASLPLEQAPMCMPGLDVLMRYFSWSAVLKALFWGTADCGEVTWRWLGLSMPAWSFLFFLMLLMASLSVLVMTRQSSNNDEIQS